MPATQTLGVGLGLSLVCVRPSGSSGCDFMLLRGFRTMGI